MTNIIASSDSGSVMNTAVPVVNKTQFDLGVFDLPNVLVSMNAPPNTPGKVASIALALESIVDEDANNPRTIYVQSGNYCEPTLVMRPYISIVGLSRQSVCIYPQDPTQTVIVGAPNALIREVTIKGAINEDNPAVVYEGGPGTNYAGQEFRLSRVFFINNALHMRINSSETWPQVAIDLQDISLFTDETTIGGIQINGLTVNKPVLVGIDRLVVQNTGQSQLLPNYEFAVYCSGSGCHLNLTNLKLTCNVPTEARGIHIQDGASVRLFGGLIIGGYENNIHVDNIGASPTLTALSISSESLTKYGPPQSDQLLNVEHPGTRGSFIGSIDRTGVSIVNGSHFTVSASDPIAGTGISSGGVNNQSPASSFVFNQNTPSPIWTIVHNLGFYPSVSVVDSTGQLVEGDVMYSSINQVVVSFSAPFSGSAYCN